MGSEGQVNSKLCPACGERSPVTFEACWNCAGDLAQVTATRAPVEPTPEDEPQPEPAALATSPRVARASWLDVLVVALVVVVPSIAGGLWNLFEGPFPLTPFSEIWLGATSLGWIVLALFLTYRNDGSLVALGLNGERWITGALLSLPILALTVGAQLGTGALTAALGLEYRETDSLLVGEDPSPWLRPLLPFTLLIPAFMEEVIYRGYLWIMLSRLTRRPGVSLAVCAALFAATHVRSLAASLDLFAYGMVMGLAFWKLRNLPSVILAHWAFNMLIFFWSLGP